jgi:hypothetical protein
MDRHTTKHSLLPYIPQALGLAVSLFFLLAELQGQEMGARHLRFFLLPKFLLRTLMAAN